MSPPKWSPNTYPAARRSDHVDIYKSATKGEVAVADPYRWLEEYSGETEKFIDEQEAYTRSYIDKYPHRQRLEDTLLASQDYARFTTPSLRDDNRWYWFYNSGLQGQYVYYRSKDSQLPASDGTDRLANAEIFLDANLFSVDGTASLAVHSFSEDGQHYAYGVSYAGSDFTTVYIRPTSKPLDSNDQIENDTGRLPERLNFVKFSSIVWSPDSKGFFYQRYPDHKDKDNSQTTGIETRGDVDAMLYYHRIGTPQSDDILVYYDKSKPDNMYGVGFSFDKRYLFLHTSRDTARKNLLWVAEYDPSLINKGFAWNKIVDEYEAEYDYVENDGPLLYLRTNKDAPKYKLITLDLSKDNETRDLIGESDGLFSDIQSVNQGKNFAVVYKRNVVDELFVYDKKGVQIERLAADFIGSISLSSRQKQTWFFASMVGFTSPGTVARYDFNAPEGQRWNVYSKIKVANLDPDEFDARQVWFQSKDGTKVPMFIVRHKETQFDGTAPAIQYGYGGFSVSIDPSFSPTILTLLKTYGFVYAVANIRGGSEFGEDWHKAGYRENKHNCFDDFIAATEFLVKEKYAAPGKVAISGGSNGGLLVAACVNRAPEGLLGAAVADVGVHDLLRFHKFTIGKAWTSDYGNPDDPNDFDFIYPISPLHNVPTDKTLPPTLLLTADHDDRVVPMHSFKHAATLQHCHANNPDPLLLRVNKKTGHGAGKNTKQAIREAADKWSFVVQSMNVDWKDPVEAQTKL